MDNKNIFEQWSESWPVTLLVGAAVVAAGIAAALISGVFSLVFELVGVQSDRVTTWALWVFGGVFVLLLPPWLNQALRGWYRARFNEEEREQREEARKAAERAVTRQPIL